MNPIIISGPNGSLISLTHTCELILPGPPAVEQDHIVADLKHAPLILSRISLAPAARSHVIIANILQATMEKLL